MSHPLGFLRVKVVAIAVTDSKRANDFYGKTLGLPPAVDNGETIGFQLENTILMLKPSADWYGKPGTKLNARITLEVENAADTEEKLRGLGVPISDPVETCEGHLLGAFLDSEGNKIWFCSEGGS